MTKPHDLPTISLQFYATAPYECSYLEDQVARSQVATPSHLIDSAVYSQLVHHGFRRSGTFTYRPHCDTCQACIPLRIPVQNFQPNRTQMRTWRKCKHLAVREKGLDFDAEHYALYQRYLQARHSGGGMDEDSPQQYTQFLLQSGVDTRLLEFRDGEQLIMVSIVDILDDGISAVYTFYEPKHSASYGIYNILWQVQLARAMGLEHVYLGYWIEQSRKMRYKTAFRGYQMLLNGQWLNGTSEGEKEYE